MTEEIWECAIKRLTNNETEASASKLNNWLEEEIKNQQEFESIKALWDLTGKIPVERVNDFNDVERLIVPSETLTNNIAYNSYLTLINEINSESLGNHASLLYYFQKQNIFLKFSFFK